MCLSSLQVVSIRKISHIERFSNVSIKDDIFCDRMREGLKDVLNMSKLGNQYIQSNKPWVLVKGSEVDR